MKSLLKIVKYIVPYKGLAWLSVVSNILHVIFNLLSILAFIPFLQVLTSEAKSVTEAPELEFSSDYIEDLYLYKMTPYIEQYGEEGALLFCCVIVGILFFLKNLFRYLAKFFLASIRSGVVRDIREQVYKKILVLPLSFYSEEKKGDIISRITGDVQEIEWSIMNSLEMIFRDPIAIILSLIFMITMNAELTLFAFVLLCLFQI